jgi:O-antigen/teichoic acid export membrane protein
MIVYPYVSRVLGVENIGICNFVDSIINYSILFSMLGISAVGIREISRIKDDDKKLQSTFSSVFLINACSTGVMLIVLIVAIAFVPKLNQYQHLMYLGALKLIFNLLLVEWFFKGLENFKFITSRSVIVRVIFVFFVFIFVKHKQDFDVYYFLLVSVVICNALINSKYRMKWIRFSFEHIRIRPFVKSVLVLGSYMILTSMYTSFNVAYLGFVTTVTEVGYYTTATKLFGIALSIFTAFTAVMLPHISGLVEKGNYKEIKRLTNKSYEMLIAFCLPVVIISVIFAPQIIQIIAGHGYDGAIMPMRIIMPLMLIVGMAQILVLQLLMPLKKDRAIFINSFLGAFVSILLNLILVQSYRSSGSAISLVASEFTVLISAQYFVRKEIGLKFPVKNIFINFLYLSPVMLVCSFFQWGIHMENYLNFIFAIAISGLYIGLLQVVWLKNPLALSLIKTLKKKMNFIE